MSSSRAQVGAFFRYAKNVLSIHDEYRMSG
jgi:hypothetical protein